MSDVQDTSATTHTTDVAENPVIQPSTTETTPETMAKEETPAAAELPAAEAKTAEETSAESKPVEETAPTEEKTEEAAATEKVIEPITEGQLTYKGPGLLKSLIPSKKEFWLNDDAVSSEELNSYMRGEKPEISQPVVAWASQTGKGLLFFNKKGDTSQKHPGHVFALYDATDLKKQSPHEILFKLHGQEHTLKAANDTERDGWYISIEKAVEIGKASKEEIHESEGYKEELEKVKKPHVAAVAAAASKRSQSRKKSSEAERADSEVEDQKKIKSRSTSRGVLNRFKGKKDEAEPKKEEANAVTEADKEEAKPEGEKTTDEVAAAAAGTAIVGAAGIAAAEVHGSDEAKDSTESPVEAAKTEEKAKMDAKPAKRGSIFGKIGGWGAMKSPTKEKDAELKPEVTEDPPVLPETATTEHTDADAEANKIEAKAENEVAKENPDANLKKEAVTTPGKEKSGFLSGFLPKRGRSVSPSTAQIPTTDAAKTETTEEAAKEPAAAEEETKAVESTPEATTVAPAAETTEKPADSAETPTQNKRQSIMGSLSRRASKAMSGMRGQKKENVAPTGEVTTAEEKADEIETPAVNGETKAETTTETEQPTIGDVVPSAVTIGQEQPPAVTASA